MTAFRRNFNHLLRGEKAITGSPEVIAALQGGWNAYPLLGSGSRQRIQDVYNRAQSASYAWMYQNSPAVRTTIDVLVRNVGQLDLRLYEEMSPGERQPAYDHPAARSFRYPNENTSSDKFIREMFLDFLIYGNAYALVAPAPKNELSFIHIPAYMLVVMGDNLWEAENYRVWPMGAWNSSGSWGGGGTYKDFTPDQIMHWHNEYPLDPRFGLSLLDTIRDVIAEDAALQAATIELAKNGLQEPVWVKRPLEAPPIKNEIALAMEEDLKNRMMRRNEKPIMLAEGMSFESFGVSPRDAQMYEIRRWAIERVAALYGMPLGMVGLDPDLAGARQEFLTDTLPPLCGDFTSFANQRILTRVYDLEDYCFEFNLDEKSMNADDRLATLTSAAGVPILLRNEARAMINKPPVEGGDEPITPANIIVGDNPLPAPNVMPIQDANKPPADGSYRNDDGPTPVASGTSGDDSKSIASLNPGADLPAVQIDLPPVSRLQPVRQADMDRQQHNIGVFQGVVQKHYDRLERHLRNLGDRDPDWDRFAKEFSVDLDLALKSAVGREGDIYSFKLASANFKSLDVVNYLQAVADGSADAINTMVRKDIADLGLDDAMARAPQHVATSGTSLGARATIWARQEAVRQSGTAETRKKMWVSDTGRHAEWDGLVIPFNEDWPAGFGPGVEPGCACTMSVI